MGAAATVQDADPSQPLFSTPWKQHASTPHSPLHESGMPSIGIGGSNEADRLIAPAGFVSNLSLRISASSFQLGLSLYKSQSPLSPWRRRQNPPPSAVKEE